MHYSGNPSKLKLYLWGIFPFVRNSLVFKCWVYDTLPQNLSLWTMNVLFPLKSLQHILSLKFPENLLGFVCFRWCFTDFTMVNHDEQIIIWELFYFLFCCKHVNQIHVGLSNMFLHSLLCLIAGVLLKRFEIILTCSIQGTCVGCRLVDID